MNAKHPIGSIGVRYDMALTDAHARRTLMCPTCAEGPLREWLDEDDDVYFHCDQCDYWFTEPTVTMNRRDPPWTKGIL